MLLVDRERTTRAIAMHLLLRRRPQVLFRRNSEEVGLEEVVDGIVDAILTVPQKVLGDFVQEEAVARAAATDFIARVVSKALTDCFEPVQADRPGGARFVWSSKTHGRPILG
ncbi:hypothetical protein CO661_01495 [Sinorhizobium fredii]|uniref:Uncharacterized protein n=1 Tax=Rhizobium fredii TaxID=380 RepID=A0A2A6M7R8_RHIFR|nr:hypothetical protein CO661_01495 [Sinorhizobium fredii]